MTAERSSRAVNRLEERMRREEKRAYYRAIVDLSTGRNDVMDNVSKWGDVGVAEENE